MMSDKLKEFLRNKTDEVVLACSVKVLKRDYENDARKYREAMERSLLQQALDGKSVDGLSLQGNKQLIQDIKREFHVETFEEDSFVYMKIWMPEVAVDVAKYEKHVKEQAVCPQCGGAVGRDWKFCPKCGGLLKK